MMHLQAVEYALFNQTIILVAILLEGFSRSQPRRQRMHQLCLRGVIGNQNMGKLIKFGLKKEKSLEY